MIPSTLLYVMEKISISNSCWMFDTSHIIFKAICLTIIICIERCRLIWKMPFSLTLPVYELTHADLQIYTHRLTGFLKIHDRTLTRLLSPLEDMGEGGNGCVSKDTNNSSFFLHILLYISICQTYTHRHYQATKRKQPHSQMSSKESRFDCTSSRVTANLSDQA